jgi:hypothetical protein
MAAAPIWVSGVFTAILSGRFLSIARWIDHFLWLDSPFFMALLGVLGDQSFLEVTALRAKSVALGKGLW